MKKTKKTNLEKLSSEKGLRALFSLKQYNTEKAIRFVDYEKKLKKLQIELVRLQTWGINEGKRIIVIFEGRDAAGKGGAIRRATERINPRHLKIVALPKPDEAEKTQWYFQRYVDKLPKAGEIVFFDRSWYNRAIVEPVNGFCTDNEYQTYMNQVNEFEKMLVDSGIQIVKIYMSISKNEQIKRFEDIKKDPLKQWKMSAVDEKAQELWDEYTKYKKLMFQKTHTDFAPWKVIRANRKTEARVNVIRHLLNSIPYNKNLEI